VGNVIELKFNKKPNRDVMFESYCVDCEFGWVALAQENATFCKCPLCNTVTVDMQELDSENTRWVCECGFDVFHVSNIEISCAQCGETQASFHDVY
jgi:hypothetical protein